MDMPLIRKMLIVIFTILGAYYVLFYNFECIMLAICSIILIIELEINSNILDFDVFLKEQKIIKQEIGVNDGK